MPEIMENATEQERSRMGWVIVSVFVLGMLVGSTAAITLHSTECKLAPGEAIVKATTPARPMASPPPKAH